MASASIERGDHQGGSYQATREGTRVMPSGSVGVEIRAGTLGTSSLWLQRVQKGNECVKNSHEGNNSREKGSIG